MANPERRRYNVLVQRIVPAYKEALIARLSREFDFCVYHSRQAAHSEVVDVESLGFRNVRTWRVYSPGSRTIVFLGGQLRRLFARPPVLVLEGSAGILSNYVDILLARICGTRIVAWTFGFDPDRGATVVTIADRARRWLFRHVDAVVVYWEYGRRELMRSDPTIAERCFTAPNVIGRDLVEPMRSALDEVGRTATRSSLELPAPSVPVILFVGRLVSVKQCDHFLASAAQLRSRYPEARWYVVGDGPELSVLRRNAAELQVSDIVDFVGHVPPRDLGRWLFSADLLVIPGRLGLAVSHAAAFGCPVVSIARQDAFHGEGAEHLVEGRTGWWAESAASLPALIDGLIADGPALARARLTSREYYEKNLSEDATVEGFRCAIEYALSRGGRHD